MLVRRDIAPGVDKPEDIAKAKMFKAGGVSPPSIRDTRMRLVLDVLGVNYGYVTGYKGGGKVRLAFQQNEVQALMEGLSPYRGRTEASLVKSGMAIPLCQNPPNYGQGVIERSRLIPEMPTCARLAETLTGKLPSGIAWEAFNLIHDFSSNITRAVFLPAGTSHGTLGVLRAAFRSMAKDPAYMAEAKKIGKIEPQFIFGAKGEALLKEMLTPDKRLLGFLRDYVEAGRKARR